MKTQFFIRHAIPLVTAFALWSCGPKASDSAGANSILPAPNAPEEGKPAAPIERAPDLAIPLSDVSAGGCLQLPRLRDRLNDLNVPAATITTDHLARSNMSPDLKKYFAFSSFEYRIVASGTVFPLPAFTQEGCKEVVTHTASGEPVKFNIIKHAEGSLTLERARTSKDVPSHVAKALDKRARVTKYLIEYDPAVHALKLETEYFAIDPLCGTEKLHELSTTRKITWAARSDLLPRTYTLAEGFRELLKASVVDGVLPGFEENTLSVNALTPMVPVPELMKCH